MRRIDKSTLPIILAVLVLSALLGAGSALGAAAAPRGSVASAKSVKCGTVRVKSITYHVSVTKGHVECTTARRVLTAFFRGKGKPHGPTGGPSYKQWWSVEGWGCGYGTGGSACSRDPVNSVKAKDRILAQAT